MKFFWRKPAFKFPRFEQCLRGLALTGENGKPLKTPLDFFTRGPDEHVLILEKCKVRRITLTYLFNGDYPDLEIHSVPNFCPSTDEVVSKASRMGNICNSKSFIVASFVLILILPTTVIGILVAKWRRKELLLAKRSRFQSHRERRTSGGVRHITFDEARGIDRTRDRTEEPEKEKSSSTFGSGTQDGKESRRNLFLAVESEWK